MEGKISGSWPGGPKRDGEAPERTHPPRLERVEEIERRSASRSLRRQRKARTTRFLFGIGFSALVAGGFGWVLGLRSHVTLQEINAEQVAQEIQESDMATEINRVMLELWRMEDVEYERNRSGR